MQGVWKRLSRAARGDRLVPRDGEAGYCVGKQQAAAQKPAGVVRDQSAARHGFCLGRLSGHLSNVDISNNGRGVHVDKTAPRLISGHHIKTAARGAGLQPLARRRDEAENKGLQALRT